MAYGTRYTSYQVHNIEQGVKACQASEVCFKAWVTWRKPVFSLLPCIALAAASQCDWLSAVSLRLPGANAHVDFRSSFHSVNVRIIIVLNEKKSHQIDQIDHSHIIIYCRSSRADIFLRAVYIINTYFSSCRRVGAV